MQEFSAFGKFLISGEYLVLHGARALALPLTKMIQHLMVVPSTDGAFHWRASDAEDAPWLELVLDPELRYQGLLAEGHLLADILTFLRTLRPELFSRPLSFETRMNFPRRWGLGSSSTLVSVLSQWAGLDPFTLQRRFFGGSGYDVACAQAQFPIIFRTEDSAPEVREIPWAPAFREKFRFVYLERKQNSRDAIARLRKFSSNELQTLVAELDGFTDTLLRSKDLQEFMATLRAHEELLAGVLGEVRVKERLFPDFPGEIKSLGAWGGDFVLAASPAPAAEAYFLQRGFPTVLAWDDLIR